MKLARVIHIGGAWVITELYSIVDRPPVGTIVQYEPIINVGCDMYFPGILGHAPITWNLFWEYFEDIDSETS